MRRPGMAALQSDQPVDLARTVARSARIRIFPLHFLAAGVAELADALDSKSSDRKIVWVRAPPPARFFKRWNLSVQRWTFAGVSSSVCRQKKSRDASTSLGMTTFAKSNGFEPLRRQL